MMAIAEKLDNAGFEYTTTIIKERGKRTTWLRIERPGRRIGELMGLLGNAPIECVRDTGEIDVVLVRIVP